MYFPARSAAYFYAFFFTHFRREAAKNIFYVFVLRISREAREKFLRTFYDFTHFCPKTEKQDLKKKVKD